MTIFVTNIDYSASPAELSIEFETRVGPIERLSWITDRITGKFRGFAFIDFMNPDDGQKAIFEMNDSEFKGRKLIVREATPKPGR